MSTFPKAALLALACFVAAAVWVRSPAVAQEPPCAERDAILERLKQRYGEVPIAFGVARDGRLIEIFVSPTGSWTVVKTHPRGRSCVVDAGRGWRSLNVENTDPEA